MGSSMVMVIPVTFPLKWMSGLILYGMLCFGFNCSNSSDKQIKLLSLGCLPGWLKLNQGPPGL